MAGGRNALPLHKIYVKLHNFEKIIEILGNHYLGEHSVIFGESQEGKFDPESEFTLGIETRKKLKKK